MNEREFRQGDGGAQSSWPATNNGNINERLANHSYWSVFKVCISE
jgi:hypothetical protein